MTTTEKGIQFGMSRASDWLATGDANWQRLARMINEQWAPRPAAFSGLTYAYFGGWILTGSVYSQISDGTIALTDNATNYVERTAAGVVSKNTSGFSNSPSIPMAKVTTLSGAITAIVEARFYSPVDTTGGGGGTGGLTLLESHTAAASSSLDFTTRNASGQSGATFQSDFDEYVMEFVNMILATTGQSLWWRASTNGGSSYDSSSIYFTDQFAWRAGGTGLGGGGGTGAGQITLTFPVSNSAARGTSGMVSIYDPLSASLYKQMRGGFRIFDGSFRAGSEVSAGYESATAVNACRVLSSSGNITSGTVRLYGVPK